MTASPSPTVLVVGSGAIGSFYGSALRRAGARVSVVARSDAQVIRRDGITIDSPLGDLSFKPEHVHASVDEAAEPPDYLLLTTKVLDGVNRAALVKPAVGKHTRIVLIQNGIGIEDELAQAYGNQRVISALAFIGVSRSAPGKVVHHAYGLITLGNYPQGVDESTRALAALFTAGGIPASLSEEIVGERWRKTVWNAAFNPLSVLAGGADTALLLGTESGEALVRALMDEVCQVAAAEGHALPSDQVAQYIASTRQMPPYRNSMALDLKAGRPVELDAILGNVLEAATRHGVPVPRLRTVHTAVELLIANLRGERQAAG